MKIIITPDLTGISQVNESFPSTASFMREFNFSHTELGLKYKGFPSHVDQTIERLKEDPMVITFTPIYAVFSNEDGSFESFTLEKPEIEWNTGIAGFFIFDKKFLKKNFEFKRIGKKISSDRLKEINLFAEEKLDILTLEVKEETLYTVLKEIDGKVEDSIDGIAGFDNETIAKRAAELLSIDNLDDYTIEKN